MSGILFFIFASCHPLKYCFQPFECLYLYSVYDLHLGKLYFQKKIVQYCYNPNTIKSYKILQKLSPQHAAHGVAQSTYPIYRHGKACLSKQPPWRAAGDPRLARGRSRVRAPGPAGARRALFFLHPPFPLREIVFFRTFPTNPAKVLGLWYLLL